MSILVVGSEHVKDNLLKKEKVSKGLLVPFEDQSKKILNQRNRSTLPSSLRVPKYKNDIFIFSS